MADKKCECTADASVESIQKMAEVFEKTSDEAWAMMVRQQLLNGIFDLCLCGISFVAAIWLFRKIARWTKSRNFDWDSEHGIGAILGGLICIAGFIASIVIGFQAAKQLLNPSYYAVVEMIEGKDSDGD